MAIIDTKAKQKLIKKKVKVCVISKEEMLIIERKKVSKIYELVGELFSEERAKLKYMNL